MTDAEIVAGLREGHEAAFVAAWRRWQVPLRGHAARMTGDLAVADDIVQETFLRLARHGRGLRADSRIAAWLFTVASNLGRSHRRWAWLDGDRLLVLWRRVRRGPDRPDEIVEAQRALQAVHAALEALPPAEREVAALTLVAGLELGDVALVLGVSPEAARQRSSRAKAKLRAALERGGVDVGAL